jgi:D-alanyl-D-alanine dipeptidase
MRVLTLLLILTACGSLQPRMASTSSLKLSGDFVSLGDLDPSIAIEMRYWDAYNFLGRRAKGYREPKCLLTRAAAEALVAAQQELKDFGYGLKVYDCFRPQRAVDDFVAWARDPKATDMKREFYPEVEKKDLFKKGYLAGKSGHSRGSTIDLTLVPTPAPPQRVFQKGDRQRACFRPFRQRFDDNSLDMGTNYDCFDPLSRTAHPKAPPEARKNRLLLKTVLEKHGFENLPEEWWHYTLKNEPHPNQYFDFEVR